MQHQINVSAKRRDPVDLGQVAHVLLEIAESLPETTRARLSAESTNKKTRQKPPRPSPTKDRAGRSAA